jgi:hypothetical protein
VRTTPFHRLGTIVAPLLALGALALGAVPAHGAANPNLVINPSFERPKVTAASGVRQIPFNSGMPKCPSGSAIGCWLVRGLSGGPADLTRDTVWQAAAGHQSVELETAAGDAAGTSINQSVVTVSSGVTYKFTFWMSADPSATDNIGVSVFLYNVDGGGQTLPGSLRTDFSYFDPTHTAANMKYVKHTITYVSQSTQLRISIAANGFLGDPTIGPVIDRTALRAV